MPAPPRYFPDEQLRRALAEARREGRSFDQAWDAALPTLAMGTDGRTRQAWAEAFEWTRDAWERAYVGEPPTRAEAAAAQLDGLGNGRPHARPSVPALAA